jgi:2',3'-cyclic-nucleotide 2'-phosphodiesterase (5'-nucleotidase family)
MKNNSYFLIFLKICIICCLFLLGCKPTHRYLSDVQTRYYQMAKADSLPPADTSLERLISGYRVKLDAEMNEIVGTTAKELLHFQPISPLGIWAAETIHRQTALYSNQKIDLTCFGHNGLRIKSLPNGKVTRGKIYELMPFDNFLVVMDADSAVIQQMLNLAAFKGGWPVAGATYEIENQKAHHIIIQGEPLRSGKIYKLATSDYVANGGDNAFFLKPVKRKELTKLMRDAFLEGAMSTTKAGQLLDAEIDERVKIIKK